VSGRGGGGRLTGRYLVTLKLSLEEENSRGFAWICRRKSVFGIDWGV
jgi:hypothetical protein